MGNSWGSNVKQTCLKCYLRKNLVAEENKILRGYALLKNLSTSLILMKLVMMMLNSFDGRADYEVFPDIQPSIVCSEQQKSFRPAIRPHHCGKGWG